MTPARASCRCGDSDLTGDCDVDVKVDSEFGSAVLTSATKSPNTSVLTALDANCGWLGRRAGIGPGLTGLPSSAGSGMWPGVAIGRSGVL